MINNNMNDNNILSREIQDNVIKKATEERERKRTEEVEYEQEKEAAQESREKSKEGGNKQSEKSGAINTQGGHDAATNNDPNNTANANKNIGGKPFGHPVPGSPAIPAYWRYSNALVANYDLSDAVILSMLTTAKEKFGTFRATGSQFFVEKCCRLAIQNGIELLNNTELPEFKEQSNNKRMR